jgi:hydroxymethylpyrimidine pyrophosphatase-like HAD family hydrolase
MRQVCAQREPVLTTSRELRNFEQEGGDMRYQALACDYDGTLAHHGKVADNVIQALTRLRESGRKLLMVTGRELPDLSRTFDHLEAFDYIVVENGATLYRPMTGEHRALGTPPAETFVQALLARGVGPISVGKVIVATWSPHETAVLETIRDLGLELQVIFNKGAVMILPTGINKATGLTAALGELGIPSSAVVAIGDAENDHALLDAVGVGVAVSNAVPMLKERAALVTAGDHGDGVIELIDHLLRDDLEGIAPRRGSAGH